jgi:uncharacterized membrane protein
LRKILFAGVIVAMAMAGCSGKSGKLDALIRSEPSLARLALQLQWTLDAAGGGNELLEEQEQWRKGLERCLEADDPAQCVADAHAERIEDLQARFDLDPRSVALDAAAREGYEFRAMGNEPGWNLLVSEQRCVWETDYGQTRHEIRSVEYETDGDTRIYRGTVDRLAWEARIEPGPCEDDMSGESFPWSAVIRHGDRTWRGCAEPTTP